MEMCVLGGGREVEHIRTSPSLKNKLDYCPKEKTDFITSLAFYEDDSEDKH